MHHVNYLGLYIFAAALIGGTIVMMDGSPERSYLALRKSKRRSIRILYQWGAFSTLHFVMLIAVNVLTDYDDRTPFDLSAVALAALLAAVTTYLLDKGLDRLERWGKAVSGGGAL